MMAPGVEVLGNKALLPYLDDIVTFYSREQPILRTATTALCESMPGDPSGWVFKKSNGCQGNEVFFLDEMSGSAQSQLEARLREWGRIGAVLQRRVSASFLPISRETTWHRFQIELRPVAFVVGDGVCAVSEHASGRALSNLGGRGLGNISQGAHYLAVIREPVPTPRGRVTPDETCVTVQANL